MHRVLEAAESLLRCDLHDLRATTSHERVELKLEAVLEELQGLITHHLDLADDTFIQLVLPLESLDRVHVLILAGLTQLRARADNYRGLVQTIIFLVLWLIYSAEATIFTC